MKTLYVTGKIAGLDPDVAKAYFDTASEQLSNAGYIVYIPHDIMACDAEDCNGPKPTSAFEAELLSPQKNTEGIAGGYQHTWQCYLRHDLAHMLKYCDGVAQLHNWLDSQGARLESYVAQECGMPVARVHEWVNGTALNGKQNGQ